MIETCKKCPKTIGFLLKLSRCLHHNCQLSIVNCQFGRSPLNIPSSYYPPIRAVRQVSRGVHGFRKGAPAFPTLRCLYFSDHAAGDLLSRVSAGLGVKVIGSSMEDYRSADHLSHRKTPGEHLHVCLSAVSRQRRQIPGMVWMQVFAGVKMGAGSGKPFPTAITPLVDMKSEKVCFCPGKPVNVRFHHNAVPALVKLKATPHNCVSGSQRIFCTISAVSKTGNTYSIPPFLKL